MHGTDTMQFSASALSFMLDTPVPVVFTGSQRSADRPSSDNVMNAVCSVEAAKADCAEVLVCMHATESDDVCALHRGNARPQEPHLPPRRLRDRRRGAARRSRLRHRGGHVPTRLRRTRRDGTRARRRPRKRRRTPEVHARDGPRSARLRSTGKAGRRRSKGRDSATSTPTGSTASANSSTTGRPSP